MHSSILHPLFTSTLLAVVVHGFNLDKATDGAPRVVSLPVRQQYAAAPRLGRRQEPRQGTLEAPLSNQNLEYMVNLTVGTPPQHVTVQIDTGSSDFWVTSKPYCESGNIDTDQCESYGTFSANDSSTYAYLNSNLNVAYMDGTKATGDFVTDSVTLGNVTVENMRLGIAYDETNALGNSGILGVSYPSGEGVVQLDPTLFSSNNTAIINQTVTNASYPNFPARLAQGGFIQTAAYSLWLNSIDADEGSILFGGVDTERFDGSLTAVPVYNVRGLYVFGLAVHLDSVSVGGNVVQNTSQIPPAAIDSGTTFITLPPDMAFSLYGMLDVVWDANSTNAFCECSLRDSRENVTFSFPNLDVNVSMRSLVLDHERYPGDGVLGDYDELCRFGVSASSSAQTQQIALGDTFLRSVYAVYDLENNEISMAPARYGSPRSNIVEIGREGADGIRASPRQEGDPDHEEIMGDSDSSADVMATGAQLLGLMFMFVSGLIVM